MRIIPRKPLPSKTGDNNQPYIPEIKIPSHLKETMELLNPYIAKSDDIISRSVFTGGGTGIEVQIIYLNGVADGATVYEHILRPIMLNDSLKDIISGAGEKPLDAILKTSVTVSNIKKTDQFNMVVNSIFDGMLVIMADGCPEALVVDIHGGETRSVEEPPAEKSSRGARDGFVESLDVNLALIRRRLRDPRLIVKKMIVGQRSRTPVALAYIEDIVAPQILEVIRKRIENISIDAIPASGFIEQFIEDHPYSLFPQVRTTERPDKIMMEIMEGRVAILVDGTPTILVAPTLFLEFFQAPEDYMERTVFGSYIRILRFLAFFLAISLPALYIALLSFQPELIPIDLLVSLAQARKEVPFPAVVEILVQELIIQLVIEAGLRMPQPIAQTTGVVAGIVLGQAAISAKLASPGVIVIISITTICTFVLPSTPMVQTSRVLRVLVLLLSSMFGLFGFSLAWLFILTHLAGLESFGIAYFSPFSPTRFSDMGDAAIRKPLWKQNYRPVSIPHQDRERQGNRGGTANENSK